MSTRRKIRRPEQTSLRIAVPVTFALYGLLFGGLALLPHGVRAERGGEPAGVEVVLASGPVGSPAPAATPRDGNGAGERREHADRRGEPPATRALAVREQMAAAAGVGPEGGAAAQASGDRRPTEGGEPAIGGATSEKNFGKAGHADAYDVRGPAVSGGLGEAAGVVATRAARRAAVAADGGRAGDAGPGGPAAHGASDGESGALAVLDLIRERIQRERTYPFAARLHGIEGTVTASVTVDGQGELSGERIVRSSGSAILDRAGLALLRRVFPVPNDSGTGFDLEVRISYRLVGEGGAE